MDVLGKVTGRGKVDKELSGKQRALKKRLLRKFDGQHLTSANIDVSQVNFNLDEEAAKIELARLWGVPVDKVDLDEPMGSGVARRRQNRIDERAVAKSKRRGQKAFNRQERESVRRAEVARAMALHQNDDTPMGDNIQAAIRGFEKAQAAQEANETRRAARRAQHEANRAANGTV
jgi:hypothetical protein